MPKRDGIAEQALAIIADLWRAEGNRIQWVDPVAGNATGFDWWPGDFRVQVRTALADQESGVSQLRISVKTDFLKDVAFTDSFTNLLAVVSRFSSTYASVYPPDQNETLPKVGGARRRWTGRLFGRKPILTKTGSLSLESTAYLWSDDSLWAAQFLGKTGLFQPINAQIQAAQFSKSLRAGTPEMTRPAVLRDAELDPILDTIAQAYVPAGEQPSRWIATGEFEKFVEEYGRSDACLGFANPVWLGAQTPFGNEVATINFRTDQSHPQLGNGLLAVLELPVHGTINAMAKIAAELNFREARSWTGFPLLGCWSVTETKDEPKEKGLGFGLFVPNALYQPGLVTLIAHWFVDRAGWARQERFPELPDVSMSDIIERQYGHLMKEP